MAPNGFSVSAQVSGCCLLVTLSGELDLSTVTTFHEELATVGISRGIRHAVLACSELDFADSTALGAMLQLATALPEGAAVVGAKGPLAKILSIMGLTDQLPMFCTMDEAQHKLHAA